MMGVVWTRCYESSLPVTLGSPLISKLSINMPHLPRGGVGDLSVTFSPSHEEAMKYDLEPGRKITVSDMDLGVMCLQAKRIIEISERGHAKGEGGRVGGTERAARAVGGEPV